MALAVIVPTILTDTVEQYKASMEKYRAFAKRIQVDFSDGTMTGSKTVELSVVTPPVGVAVDIHLMSANPELHVERILKIKPKPNLVIFHAEAEGDLLPLFEKLRIAGIKVGVAFLKKSYPGEWMRYGFFIIN